MTMIRWRISLDAEDPEDEKAKDDIDEKNNVVFVSQRTATLLFAMNEIYSTNSI